MYDESNKYFMIFTCTKPFFFVNLFQYNIYIYIQNLKRNRMQKVKTRWNAINIARKN